MVNSSHYINGLRAEEPENWQDISVQANWEKGKIDATISLDKLIFKGQSAIDIKTLLDNNGYFEGIPYAIKVGSLTNPVLSYKGYLDGTDSPDFLAPNILAISLKREQGEDWIRENAERVTYRFLQSDDNTGGGKITSNDFSGVPYVINYIPDGVELLLLTISTFILTKELVESIQSIAKQTTDLIEGVTPTVGTSVGLGAGVVTAWSLGKIIGSIINLALTIAYTVGIVFALIDLVEQIIEQLAPVKRFHKGMTVRQLFSKACEHLNLTLSSTLLDALDTGGNKWVVIPSKGHKGGLPPTGADNTWKETGVPTRADGLDNFGDVIRTFSEAFNADYKVKDGVFQFENASFWKDQSTFVIPNSFTNQDDRRNEYSVNSDEIVSNYEILWDTDQQDMNTLDDSRGRSYQVVTSPKTVTNPDLVNLKGLNTVNVPFSMAIRKDKLTDIEEAIKVFLQAADFLSGQLGQPGSFAGQFNERIGSMHLSSHFTSRPKMVVMAGNSLALDQRDLLSAKKLWDFYHYPNSFVTINGENAQQKIVKDHVIDFCTEDFLSLSNNNYAETSEGEKAEILSLDWEIEKNKATISYNVDSVYDNNLKLTFLTASGE